MYIITQILTNIITKIKSGNTISPVVADASLDSIVYLAEQLLRPVKLPLDAHMIIKTMLASKKNTIIAINPTAITRSVVSGSILYLWK